MGVCDSLTSCYQGLSRLCGLLLSTSESVTNELICHIGCSSNSAVVYTETFRLATATVVGIYHVASMFLGTAAVQNLNVNPEISILNTRIEGYPLVLSYEMWQENRNASALTKFICKTDVFNYRSLWMQIMKTKTRSVVFHHLWDHDERLLYPSGVESGGSLYGFLLAS